MSMFVGVSCPDRLLAAVVGEFEDAGVSIAKSTRAVRMPDGSIASFRELYRHDGAEQMALLCLGAQEPGGVLHAARQRRHGLPHGVAERVEGESIRVAAALRRMCVAFPRQVKICLVWQRSGPSELIAATVCSSTPDDLTPSKIASMPMNEVWVLDRA